MAAKTRSTSNKSKKTGDVEALQKNWEIALSEELKELEIMEKEQEKKLKTLEKEGISSLDIFRLKKLDELQKSKNHSDSLEAELLLFFEQLTGCKTLHQESERLSKKIEDIKFVVTKLKSTNRTHFENEKKLLDVFNYIKDLKSADITVVREEITELDNLWAKWSYLKKEQITKKIQYKKQVLEYTQNKSEAEIEKLKGFFKKLKGASRGKKSDEVYRELRMISEFKNLKAIEIRDILSKINSELKNNTPEEVEKSLSKLQAEEQKILSETETGLAKLSMIPNLVKKAK